MTTASTGAGPSSGGQTRQKRVLPSRSRRGGPGIGSCDVDILILETYKRKAENEPLIPADTKFLLTTNSSLVPSSSSSTSFEAELRSHADERYFDRPEVLKAYKEQQIIQTPEFSQLSEDASVGGRFRPRSSEDESSETSDAVYEKRHRKYETFEKRQRLREKEKLKHEQYKLKERIDQLRAMDGAAFLALPATSFPPAPGMPEDGEDLPGAHVNGAAAHNEGERRRKEMIDVALSLEERYRTLLPDRKAVEREKQSGRGGSISVSVEPELDLDTIHHREDGEPTLDLEPVTELVRQETQKIKLRIKFPPRDAPSLTTGSPGKKRKSNLPPPMTRSPLTRLSKMETPASPSSFSAMPGQPSPSSQPPSPSLAPKTYIVGHDAPGGFSDSYGGQVSLDGDPMSQTRTWKRMRRAAAVPDFGVMGGGFDNESISTSIRTPGYTYFSTAKSHSDDRKAELTHGLLMTAAIRSSSAPKARKTQRHVTAFGTKVPFEIEVIRDFELPDWLQEQEDEDDVSALVDSVSAEEYLELEELGRYASEPKDVFSKDSLDVLTSSALATADRDKGIL